MDKTSRLHISIADTALRFWGKAQSVESHLAWHPIVLHSLDVTAVAASLADARHGFVAAIAQTLGLSDAQVRALLMWLAAIHDLGKFAENFQWKVPDLARALGHAWKDSTLHHSEVGYAIWRAIGVDAWSARSRIDSELLHQLFHASSAHHGQPVADNNPATNAFDSNGLAGAKTYAEWAFATFWEPHLPADGTMIGTGRNAKAIGATAWLINGFITLADWIGSDADRFRYACPSPSHDLAAINVAEYWQRAQAIATDAVAAAKTGAARPGTRSPPDIAFGGNVPAPLRPSQQALLDVALPNSSPPLFILEDATGSGKTEAALILAARLMQAGHADGLFFALPTMATANGMHARLKSVAERFFDQPEQASLVLTHGLAHLSDEVASRRANEGYEDNAGRMASSWFEDHRKAALTAHMGVGTIDQALMATLRVKHVALRFFGLFRKILIVDEVHAYDPYQTALLKQLLRAHAGTGGSAILLSATLPNAVRRALSEAFASGFHDTRRAPAPTPGFGQYSPPAPALAWPAATPPYPCLTHIAADGQPREMAIPQLPGLLRRYEIAYHTSAESVAERIVELARSGRCVAWVRNTVQEAISAYDDLRARLSEGDATITLDLFHARFAFIDRIRIENDVLKTFGKRSTGAQRRGRILIATQVIEQSLDLCFDEMFTDIAPIDLIIQRAGRLRRHTRDVNGDRIESGADQRGPLVLNVVGPPRDAMPEDANWLKRFSPGAALVYPDHGRIWKTAKVLGDALDLVVDPRGAIEAVYADGDWPLVFDRIAGKVEGAAYADAALAGRYTAPILHAFIRDAGWSSEERAPTRLGDETVELALAKVRDGRVVPYSDAGETEAARWAFSTLRIRSSWGTRRRTLVAPELEEQAASLQGSPNLAF